MKLSSTIKEFKTLTNMLRLDLFLYRLLSIFNYDVTDPTFHMNYNTYSISTFCANSLHSSCPRAHLHQEKKWLVHSCVCKNSSTPTDLINFITRLGISFNFCYLSNRDAAFSNRFPYKSGNSRRRNYGFVFWEKEIMVVNGQQKNCFQ